MKIKTGWWYIAYRQKKQGDILSDQVSSFKIIKNNSFQCSMDSFVFDYRGETFIFAELMKTWDCFGSIGYAKWNQESQAFSKWKTVIREPYHLSYPYVFKFNDDIFMIPESNQRGQIYIYQAVDFPDRWKKHTVLLDQVKCVDTSVFQMNGKWYAFTYDISDQDNKKLWLYPIEHGRMIAERRKLISVDDGCARPGGQVFMHNGQWIRVAQDCSKTYGEALYFIEFNKNIESMYQEKKLLHFTPDMLKLDKPINKLGVHTYSATKNFEVVDIKSSHFSLLGIFIRLYWKIRRTFKI